MSQASVAARHIRAGSRSLVDALAWAEVKFGAAASSGKIRFTAHFPDGSKLRGNAYLDDIAPPASCERDA